ncbi:MAG: cell division FtsA domain-containing protein [Bacillota bacterium]|nr:cell division FtsA domain-containing protein [Bacillota bacterium]
MNMTERNQTNASLEAQNKGKDYKFALDIGTRTVIGVLTSKKDRTLVVEDYEIIEHPDRAMFDGQVHDILEVSEIVGIIKNIIEERNGVKLDAVSIAAAGRALRTETVVLEKRLNVSDEIDRNLLESLEMEAIQMAADKIKSSVPVINTLYYCVGYSTIGITLDGISVRNPIGHSASNIRFSMVATFLPHNVSDTLHKVVMNCGMNIESMTLEPIAALEVSVPSNLRLLNLGIVDIGAGTSDIALTKDGNIFSYGMVDVAGDEISEALMRKYLLDFAEAEKLKLNLSKSEVQKFADIVGIEYELKTAEVIEAIAPTLDEIAEKIAESILEINKTVPDAVFMVGGSSQMPTLKERVGKAIKIDERKITLKASDKLANVEYKTELLTSPEFVTPIGIAYMSHFVRQKEFISILINSKIYRLFSRSNLTISDALVLAGFNARRLIQTRGKSLSFTLNGEKRALQGAAGEPSQILLNARHASLRTPIKDKDMIEITKPIMGKDASYSLEEFLDYNAYLLKDGEKVPVIKAVFVNGKEQEKEYRIHENDDIVVYKNNEEQTANEGKLEDASERDAGEGAPGITEGEALGATENTAPEAAEGKEPSAEEGETEKNSDSSEEGLTNTEHNGAEESNREDEDFDPEEGEEDFIRQEPEDLKVLNLNINQKALQIRLAKERYYLDDLLTLLNYRPETFSNKFVTVINGEAAEGNCEIKDGDQIVFQFK